MKTITWNVNGIRTRIFSNKMSGQNAKLNHITPENDSPIFNLLKHDPDFICLQETRCSVENGEKFHIDNYESIFNESKKDGARDANRYSGTCIFYKSTFKPISVEYQIPEYDDQEGRIIIIHFEKIVLINVYTPNSGTNFQNRLEWQTAMYDYLKTLDKPVIYCGDLNVAWRDCDVHFKIENSPTFKKNVGEVVGFLKEEREWIPEVLNLDFIDSYAHLENDENNLDKFTYWDARSRKINGLPGARHNKHGWRIDYILVKHLEVKYSESLYNIGTEYISNGDPQCSDHCPVITEV